MDETQKATRRNRTIEPANLHQKKKIPDGRATLSSLRYGGCLRVTLSASFEDEEETGSAYSRRHIGLCNTRSDPSTRQNCKGREGNDNKSRHQSRQLTRRRSVLLDKESTTPQTSTDDSSDLRLPSSRRYSRSLLRLIAEPEHGSRGRTTANEHPRPSLPNGHRSPRTQTHRSSQTHVPTKQHRRSPNRATESNGGRKHLAESGHPR